MFIMYYNIDMKIYTKKGDKGHTSTLTQNNISKGCILFDILGKIDELNVYIGNFDTDFDKDMQRILIYISGHLQNTLYSKYRRIPKRDGIDY